MYPYKYYGHSKIGVVPLTRQLAKRYSEILSFAPHHGPVRSGLTEELGVPGLVMWVFEVVSSFAVVAIY